MNRADLDEDLKSDKGSEKAAHVVPQSRDPMNSFLLMVVVGGGYWLEKRRMDI